MPHMFFYGIGDYIIQLSISGKKYLNLIYALWNFIIIIIVFYYNREEKNYLYAAGLLAFIPPYTKIAMMSTNNAIINSQSADSNLSEGEAQSVYDQAKELIKSWGPLHAVRTVVGVAAFSLLIYKSKWIWETQIFLFVDN